MEIKKIIVLALLLSLSLGIFATRSTSATVGDWQKSVNIRSFSPDDFDTESYRASIDQLASTGANFVSLVVPIYQSNLYADDVQTGYRTPTDAALTSAINYAHSKGLKVMITPHLESHTGEWRAYINANNKDAWFTNYGNMLSRYARIAQSTGAEQMMMGTELQTMTTKYNQDWINLIATIRGIYNGKLTYSANWGPSGSWDETNRIGFWPHLDYIGISAYYNLNSDGSVEGIKGAWDYWNNTQIKPLHDKYNKPILFTELGYRSMHGAHYEPWNSGSNNGYNAQEQVNAYEALFQYWNNYSYLQGWHIWEWNIDPNSGGEGNVDYTPQNKPAQATMTKWFTGGGATPTLTPTPSPTIGEIDIWWPTNGVSVSGIQPFKAMFKNNAVEQYEMFWQVDGDRLNPMFNNYVDYPHKEVAVDFIDWNWKGSGPYHINFVVQDFDHNTLAQRSIDIFVNR